MRLRPNQPASGDRPVKGGRDLARVRLDLDANGVADERETLTALIGGLALVPQPRGTPPPAVGSLPVGFDLADVTWMRGYANLIAASAEFFLAHDFRATFDATFHMFFSRSGLPFSRLFAEPTVPGRSNEMGSIFDFVAFIHLVRWDVAEPARMVSVAHPPQKCDRAKSPGPGPPCVLPRATTTTSGCRGRTRRAHWVGQSARR